MGLQLDGERIEGAKYIFYEGRSYIVMPNGDTYDLANAIAKINGMQKVVGFKDGDPKNCRFDNFIFKRTQNKSNRRKNASSLYKGVTQVGGRFQARFEGKSCGCFAQRDDAARAYDKAAKEKYGDEAVLNFPIDT